ncbi:legumain isoform X1 [Oncorhynchus kisutch]|uniref:legumain isoform X1 n=1 Tax=Oncorhynchus kisutch TaxID=8019 RepID=UPI0012DC3DAC|nr:legumain isoform X1 [Oncorhynchus kisutch]
MTTKRNTDGHWERIMLTLTLLGLSIGLVANAFPTQNSGNGKNWVVIVAGSKGWHNYRHQADACHAYQIVHKNGIPDEQIVVMMYDDLATNEQNLTPGVVINRPNGTNVYKGVPKDYTRNAVTPDNFLAVLKGDSASTKQGSGKVLKSGPNDHVFVYISARGAPGLLAFPNDELYADDLLDVIIYMHKNKTYKKMVFYIDACDSGSMMTKLPDDINVYATTATNSYACYYDEKRKTYLGDWYSVNWMENSDVEDLSKETLMRQFKVVQSQTRHVMQFGNKTLANMKVKAFQGNANARPAPPMTLQPVLEPGLIPSPDVPMAILNRTYSSAVALYLNKLRSHLKGIEQLKQKMQKVVQCVTGDNRENPKILSVKMDRLQQQCYKDAVSHYKKHCFSWFFPEHEYYLRDLYTLFNLCGSGYRTDCILMTIEKVCLVEETGCGVCG